MNRPGCLVLWVCAVLMGCRESTPEPGSFDRLYLPVDGAFWQISSFDTSGGNRDRLEIAPGASVVLLDVEVGRWLGVSDAVRRSRGDPAIESRARVTETSAEMSER